MLRRVLLPTRPGQGRDGLVDAPRFGMGDHVVLAASGRPFTSENDFAGWRARRLVITFDHTRPL